MLKSHKDHYQCLSMKSYLDTDNFICFYVVCGFSSLIAWLILRTETKGLWTPKHLSCVPKRKVTYFQPHCFSIPCLSLVLHHLWDKPILPRSSEPQLPAPQTTYRLLQCWYVLSWSLFSLSNATHFSSLTVSLHLRKLKWYHPIIFSRSSLVPESELCPVGFYSECSVPNL